MAGAGDLYSAAQQLLAACATALEDSPDGPPGIQVVWQGQPPYDCAPALFVHAGSAGVGDTYPLQPPLQPMQRITQGLQVNLVAFTITIIRCVNVIEQEAQTISLPSPALIEADSAAMYGDVWSIWNGLKNQHLAGTLFQSPSGRREFAFDAATPIRTSGGFGGWEMGVRVQLGGY